MTDKITLQSVSSIDNSLLTAINNNNAIITSAFDNTLSRDGTLPNQMGNTLDMNSNSIINLPPPGFPTSPARLQDITATNISLSFPSLVGDVTAPSNNGALTTTLATVNSNVGTFGGVNSIPVVTENAKGLTTSVTTVTPNPTQLNSVSYPASPSTNTVPVVTSANTITYEAVPNSALNTMANQTIKSNISGGTAIPSDNGLSAIMDNILGSAQGDIIFRNASNWTVLPPGTSNQVLTTGGAAANPSWTSSSGGTSLVSIQFFSSTQTITIPTSPSSATKAFIRMWGGSGGSGGISAVGNNATGGSGASGYLEKYLTGLTAGNTLAYTQGAAGAAGANTATNGGNGTASTLASGTQTITTLTANGSNGTAGATGSTTSAGTAGGTATNGDINVTGAAGTDGIVADQNTVALAVQVAGAPGGHLFAPGAKGVKGSTAASAGNAGQPGGLIIFWFT